MCTCREKGSKIAGSFVSISPTWSGIDNQAFQDVSRQVYEEDEFEELLHEADILSGKDHSNVISMTLNDYRVAPGVMFMKRSDPQLTLGKRSLKLNAQNIYQMMDWKKDCRYKVYGRLANSERGLVLVFDLGSAVMFDPLPEEYFDKRSGKMKKRINKYYPDEIRMKLGRSYSDYEATQRRSSFESLSGYMDTSGSAVPSTISEEVAASISMKDQERKRETLYGTMIGNGGDEDGWRKSRRRLIRSRC